MVVLAGCWTTTMPSHLRVRGSDSDGGSSGGGGFLILLLTLFVLRVLYRKCCLFCVHVFFFVFFGTKYHFIL